MFLENNIKSSQQFGSIEVICGSMFSGKTEKLIQRVKKARAIGMKVKVFKPLIDNRYSNISVVSHNDNKLNHSCIRYKSTKSLYIERSELISIRDIMLHGKTQSVSRLLYYFWMDMDKSDSHLQSLHSIFLKHWLSGKIEMVKRDIPCFK